MASAAGRSRLGTGLLAAVVVLTLASGLGAARYAMASGGCVDADALTTTVAVAPDIAPAVRAIAGRFNESGAELGGRCVQALVTPADPADMAELLAGQGTSGAILRRPDLWIPDSSLWLSVVRDSAEARAPVRTTGVSLARNPLVVAVPGELAGRMRGRTAPSWDSLLQVAGGIQGGAVTKNQLLPADSTRLLVPDPTRSGPGMTALVLTRTLLTNDPNTDAIFAGIARAMRPNTTSSMNTGFDEFARQQGARQPVLMASEQALWAYNRRSPVRRAVAVYPQEGTLSMDYPVALVATGADEVAATLMFQRALQGSSARRELNAAGFRTADGRAPGSYDAASGVEPARPRPLPALPELDVRAVLQAWVRLSLPVRMLTVLDTSASMAQDVPGTGLSRIQLTGRAVQAGLSLLADDSQVGVWTFSSNLRGTRDWRQDIAVGALGRRQGSATRRQMILNVLTGLRANPQGDTGLYDTMLAAFRKMQAEYQADMINSLVLITDGRNDDRSGISPARLLATLRREYDPRRPVMVTMLAMGDRTGRRALEAITDVVGGGVRVIADPAGIQKAFLEALSVRVCATGC